MSFKKLVVSTYEPVTSLTHDSGALLSLPKDAKVLSTYSRGGFVFTRVKMPSGKIQDFPNFA